MKHYHVLNIFLPGPSHYYSISEPKADYEFSVWTKPDAAGTPYENGNRYTWHSTGTSYYM